MNSHELLETFDLDGNFLGLRTRKDCHKNPKIAHRAVHLLVFKNEKELFLQKRSEKKDLYPLCWDTSVGGHLNVGESYEAGAVRECMEELGFKPSKIKFLYRYSAFLKEETELVETFATFYDKGFSIDREEVAEVKLFLIDQLFELRDKNSFSPYFLLELEHLKAYIKSGGSLR